MEEPVSLPMLSEEVTMPVIDEAKTPLFQPAGDPAGLEHLRELVNDALDVLRDVARERLGPVSPGGPQAARTAARRALHPILPDAPAPHPAETFRSLVEAYARWSVDITHPAAAARMQCPPTAAAAAAELVAATLNQSLHAWESGPFALELERHVISQMAELVGYGPEAGGTLTAGGSISNLMAVLVARDAAAPFGRTASQAGLAAAGARPIVLCSESSHFSIGRAVAISGIGQEAIVRLPSDPRGRLVPEEVDRTLAELGPDVLPVMLVACAGSTDLGWVDPLPEIARIARRHGVWLHADAAYGGGALFSSRLRGLLAGLEEADSITLDLHKYGWTPASAAIFLVRQARSLASLSQQTTTLNAPDDEAEGYIGLYGSSVQATRRSDALKIAMTLRTFGRSGMGAMVDACHDLARYAAVRVESEPSLELAAEPVLSSVLFRYLPSDPTVDADGLNGSLRRRLMAEGRALLARTKFPLPDGRRPVFLKLMFLNPATRPGDVDALIDQVLAVAAEEERFWGCGGGEEVRVP
jgi:L-2,4-diaminobutyrate decarboxylase